MSPPRTPNRFSEESSIPPTIEEADENRTSSVVPSADGPPGALPKVHAIDWATGNESSSNIPSPLSPRSKSVGGDETQLQSHRRESASPEVPRKSSLATSISSKQASPSVSSESKNVSLDENQPPTSKRQSGSPLDDPGSSNLTTDAAGSDVPSPLSPRSRSKSVSFDGNKLPTYKRDPDDPPQVPRKSSLRRGGNANADAAEAEAALVSAGDPAEATEPFPKLNHAQVVADVEESTSPSNPNQSRLKLKRNSSSQSFLKSLFKKGFGLTKRGPELSHGPVVNKSSPGIGTPDLQDVFKRDSVPDLDAVNRALDDLKAGPGSRLAGPVRRASVAEALKQKAEIYRKMLDEAMTHRDEGDNEKCRSKCLQVAHGDDGAELETRVMAYNILSYLASPGQAMNFVRDAEKLLEELDTAHPKLYKLWHAVGLARESAKAKDQKGERYPGKGKKRLSIGTK